MRYFNDMRCKSPARGIERQSRSGKTALRRASAAMALCCAVLASATASPAQTDNRTIASAHQFLTSTLQSNNSRLVMIDERAGQARTPQAAIVSYSGQNCRSVIRARDPQSGQEISRVIDWTKSQGSSEQTWYGEMGVGLFGSFQTGRGVFVDTILILSFADIGRIEGAMTFLTEKCNTASQTGF